ncbi:PYRUVATE DEHYDROGENASE E1 BETA family protein [Hibiscus syriacus]|uniref:Aldose 1-epimerase n=1 Tax=Hibiscus syriacus TaxID=106335 RepID=A0A6A2ZV66_HIBSY|nr:PYRUVATE DEHYDROGENASE E1 BETA family protein [Hibiscus syriacus]
MARISFFLFSLFIIVAYAFINGSEAKEKVGIYELKKGDMSVKFINCGATIVSVILPDKYVKEYMENLRRDFHHNDTSYIGSIVGRVANRIAGAQFTLNGLHYKLVPNEGKNMLHGGLVGFSDVVWKVKMYKKDGYAPSIVFAYHSYDGEEGFPGALEVTVSYTLHPGNRLIIVKMKAKALNKATPVNLVQHTYWNLVNHNSGDILSEQVQIFASSYTPVDSQLIPTGEIATVKGTPYDFLKPHIVGSRINKLTKGYDINYVIDGVPGKLKKTAMAKDNKSGRVMELFTNQPGVQFYSAKFLKDVKGKGGYVYQPFGALCLETRAFPDSVNHPNFPSTIIHPGKDYKHVMVFMFSISS